MIKNKKMIFLFKRKICDEKKCIYELNLRNFMRIQELKKMKKNSLKYLELHIMNLKIL